MMYDDCYYAEPNCEGDLWECQTCGEHFCQHHGHTTSKGQNVECVACERNRSEADEQDEQERQHVWIDFGDGSPQKFSYDTLAEMNAFLDGIVTAGEQWGIDDYYQYDNEKDMRADVATPPHRSSQ